MKILVYEVAGISEELARELVRIVGSLDGVKWVLVAGATYGESDAKITWRLARDLGGGAEPEEHRWGSCTFQERYFVVRASSPVTAKGA